MAEEGKRKDYFLPVSILIAGAMISGSVLYLVGGKSSEDQGLARLSGQGLELTRRDVVLGDPNAPVTFIEYGDYQCPFCGRLFTQVEPLLREEYVRTGKLKMVYRNFAFLGPESFEAAEAAACAKDEQKFWVFHDAVFREEILDGEEHNGNLNRDLFIRLAGEAGMDVDKFTACYDADTYANDVRSEAGAAQALGVNATPTVFLNSQQVQGALPYESYRTVIESLLRKS
ncbi:MAG: DsbA family protein [Candidatus Liptonbacteria bacterium]|nr:DsbA family protein [Candidatus Liptonbacteria bacterium]